MKQEPQVSCEMEMWTMGNGSTKTYPWISGRKTFYERNLTMPRFVKTAQECQFYDDMRNEPDNNKSCCECLYCKKIGG